MGPGQASIVVWCVSSLESGIVRSERPLSWPSETRVRRSWISVRLSGVGLWTTRLPTWLWQGLAWDRIRGSIPITVELRRPIQGEHPVFSPTDPELIFRRQVSGRLVEASDHDLNLVVANRRNTSAAGRAEASSSISADKPRLLECIYRPNCKSREGRSARFAAVGTVANPYSQRRAGNFETDAVAKTTSSSLDVLDLVLHRTSPLSPKRQFVWNCSPWTRRCSTTEISNSGPSGD